MARSRTSGQGRPKGSVNRATQDIKDLVIAALHDVGGQKYLAARALDCPVAFMGLLGRVLPLQITGKDGDGIAIDFRWADPNPPPVTIERRVIQTIESAATSFDDAYVDVESSD